MGEIRFLRLMCPFYYGLRIPVVGVSLAFELSPPDPFSRALLQFCRYQRVSPDCLPLSNGRKQSLRTCKEDDADSNGRIPVYPPSSFDGKPLRARPGSGSASASPTPDHHPFSHFSVSSDPAVSENQPAYAAASKTQSHHEINGVCSGGGNVLLQWGHNKRSRGSRAESRAAGDEPSGHSRQVIKIQRRAAAAATAAMPPPGVSYTRGANLRPCTPVRDSTAPLLIRSVEERSGGQGRSEKRSPPSPPEKAHRTGASLPNGGCGADAPAVNPESRLPSSDQDVGGPAGAAAAAEKLNLDQFEWPRIYISLSRKEKEDDFLAMKGTKLPQRPKKRPKNIDKTLQYCFPGTWLSDLSRGRYEVREKKCVKKKRRGLKGMESMDSESE